MVIKLLNALNAYLVSESSPLEKSFVIDFFSYYSANVLVGNLNELWGIEILGGELAIKTETDLILAATGECLLTINGEKMPLWQALFIPSMSKVQVKCTNNSVAYLAISGSLHSVDMMKKPLESNYAFKISTDSNIKSLIEELPARRIPPQILSELNDGELRVLFNEEHDTQPLTFKVIGKNLHIGVVLEPLDNSFSFKFNGLVETMSPTHGSLVKLESNRIGITLNHERFSGIFLGRLHPCDLDKIARVKRGDHIRITGITQAKYAKIYRDYVNLLNKVKSSVDKAIEALQRGAKLIRIKVGSISYEAWVEEVK